MISPSCDTCAAGCWSCSVARSLNKVRSKRSLPTRNIRIRARSWPPCRRRRPGSPAPGTSSGGCGRAPGVTQQREKLRLARLGLLHIASFDVPEAAHLLRQARDFDSVCVVLEGKRCCDLAQVGLVLRDESALLASLAGAAENVERRAAQPAQSCQHLE